MNHPGPFFAWIATLTLACCTALASGPANARDDSKTTAMEQVEEAMVVTANRIETPASEVGSSITIVSAETISQLGHSSILDVLRTVPALHVVQNGGPGAAASIFIRGAKSEHTLILVDGIEINDPMTTGRLANPAHLSVADVERIEIIRGPQSTLYGSDAMGGVIHIITRSGQGPFGGEVNAEYGQYATRRGMGHLGGSTEHLRYALSFAHGRTKGFSRAQARNIPMEDDGSTQSHLTGKILAHLSDAITLGLVASRTDADADLDNQGGPLGDDPNYTSDTAQTLAQTLAQLRLLDGRWTQRLAISWSDHQYHEQNPVDRDHPNDRSKSDYSGSSLKLDWQHQLKIGKRHTIVLGAETEREEGSSTYSSETTWGPYNETFAEQDATTSGVYVQDQIRLRNRWVSTLGARLDEREAFGSQFTYRLTTSYDFPRARTRFRASYGTGFKAPSLYQLYSSYGNPDLQPETGKGWDVGLEQDLPGRHFTLSLTCFSQDFDQMIDFDSVRWLYVNVSEARVRGVELEMTAHPHQDFTIQAHLSVNDTEDGSTGEKLIRRPQLHGGLGCTYTLPQKGNVSLNLRHVGKRDDLDFDVWPAQRVRLDAYWLLDLALNFRLSAHLKLTLRGENLLDETYQEVLGYATPGRSGFGGIRVAF